MATRVSRALRYGLPLGLLVLAALGFALYASARYDLLGLRRRGELAHALSFRGKVAVIGVSSFAGLEAEGAELVPAERDPGLRRALAGDDPESLVAALHAASVRALLVQPSPSPIRARSLAQQLANYEHVTGLRGLYLTRGAALYGADPSEQLPPEAAQALAVVARALIGGARPPRSTSFPEPLRRLRPVEVMVLLREESRPRLWRSARGTSIASALVTACTVARERWHERQQAMGGKLEALLPRMDLDVAMLEDDGTVAESDPAFIDRVFGPEHGVGFERKGTWRYLLPEATREEGKGRASRAYRKLFSDEGLPADSFARHELRLYRLVLHVVSTSPAPPEPADGLSPVRSPDEVLGPSP